MTDFAKKKSIKRVEIKKSKKVFLVKREMSV